MITVEGVTKRYDGDPVLSDVSLTVADGEFLVIAGANGSGKTTLVRQFNALVEPDSGVVKVDGQDVSEHPVAARTSVGMVFQHARDQFVAATVGADVAFGPENLGLPREEIDRRVTDALAAVNLSGRESERIDTLSGGEQARVAVAGALAMEPDHLVLDEPFVGLDLAARESVLSRLDRFADAETGIVVVTHDLRDLLDRADRVVGLRDGEIAFDAPPTEAADRLAAIDVRDPRC
jgi:biotin transport system ATP-binding protein